MENRHLSGHSLLLVLLLCLLLRPNGPNSVQNRSNTMDLIHKNNDPILKIMMKMKMKIMIK